MSNSLPADLRVRTPLEVPSDFLMAKLRGRRGRLYEAERLKELSRAADLGDIVSELYPRSDIRYPTRLEKRLAASCVDELAGLLKYLSAELREFYRRLLDRWPVENLKVLLRLFGREKSVQQSRALLIELPSRLELPVETLLESESLHQFLRRIPVEGPREGAMKALPLYEQTGQRAYLEMGLDRGYWEAVDRARSALPGRVCDACDSPVISELDAVRLVSVLRAARTYEVDWQRIRKILPGGRGELDDEVLGRVYTDPSAESLLKEVPALRQALSDAEAAESIGRIERALWRRTCRLAERQFRGSLSGPAVLISYYYLKRRELRRLKSLSELVHRSAEGQEIREELDL